MSVRLGLVWARTLFDSATKNSKAKNAANFLWLKEALNIKLSFVELTTDWPESVVGFLWCTYIAI
jgi:hypothetical protein